MRNLFKPLFFAKVIGFCFLLFGANYSYSWELGLSLDLFSGQELKPINYRKGTFYLGGHALTRSFVENFVRNFVKTQDPQNKDFESFSINFCPTAKTDLTPGKILNNSPTSCENPQFLAVLSPLKVGNEYFYITARHAIQGIAYSGTLAFDKRFDITQFTPTDLVVPFENKKSEIENVKSDLLIFIPNSFIRNQCPIFNEACQSQIFDALNEHFLKPSVKSFWLALQPNIGEMSKSNSNSADPQPWIYSSGIIDSINPYDDHIISIIPNQPILTLTKNVSNHSLPGTSGGLLRSLDLNNSKVGANFGMVICDNNDFTFALDIKELLSIDNIHLQPNRLLIITQEKNTYSSLNISCRATDGRKGGGY